MGHAVRRFRSLFDGADKFLTAFMARRGISILRISVGIIFLWFGVLKFFPGLSPAQELAGKTIDILTFRHVPTNIALLTLATWECAVGLGLMFGMFLRTTLLLLWLQMIGTAAPLLLFPNECFTHVPYAPTIEGQYIIKNLVLASAGLVVGATVRGGRLSA